MCRWSSHTFVYKTIVSVIWIWICKFNRIEQSTRRIFSFSTKEIWFVRAFVHNGLAIYGTWLYLATLLNFTIWISEIYDRKSEAISNVSTAALSLVLIGIVVYFILENFVFYSSMAYTWTPWFVLIFALGGILSKNQSSIMKPHERNRHFVLALFIMSIILTVLRLVLFIIRYVKNRIPTLQDP